MAKLNGVQTVNKVNGETKAIKYDGAVYSKVVGIGKYGDVLLRIKCGIPGQVTLGCYFEGHDNRYSDDQTVYYRDEEGDVMGSSRNRFDVFRKASESPQASAPFAEMVVSRVEAVEKRMDALEGAKDTETLVKGDRVLISGRSIYGGSGDGEIGKFIAINLDGEYRVELGGNRGRLYKREQLTKVAGTDAPVKPKTGDIVVITANTNGSRNKVGDIGKLRDVDYVDVPNRPKVAFSNGNFTKESEMRLATPAEIEQYEAAEHALATQIAKEAVFTKAGRKPNEYRKGDVVRVVYSPGASPVGSIFEVSDVRPSGNVKERGIYVYKPEHIEIVCFAENRADLAKGAC